MRALLSSRRLWAGVVGLVAIAAVLTSVIFIRGTSAAAPFQAHPISVHPIFQKLGAVQPNEQGFGCQTRPIDGSLGPRCYNPQQIRKAYDIQPLLDQGLTGTGHTIVIVDAFQSPTIAQDLQIFDAVFGLPNPTLNIIPGQGTLTPFDGNDPNQAGWAGEITLDVEWSHAVAPGATIDLVLSKTNDDADILAATKFAVDNNLGDVISMSFGEAESCMDPNLVKAQHAVFQAANAKGITLIASAGDQGADQPTCDGSSFFKSASTPASDPLVLGIGGTQLNATPATISGGQIVNQGGDYLGEVVWNETDTFGAAGGGGFSTIYSRPSYQAPFGVPNKSRGVPDVAYNGAINGGVLAAWTCPPAAGCPGNVTFVFIFGGTSAGSPQWAGLTVIANQMAGKRLGFLHDDLYHIGKKPKQQSDFHDITVGNNTFFTVPGFSATPGWDAATGLGTPDAAKLLPELVATHVGNGGKNL
ncbi:MAG TPA: S53 family peptidase [Ktedonobacterales bacterium]|jgi:subtilase family serine protease